MVSTEEKKEKKLIEFGFETEKYSELMHILLKNWSLTNSILKNNQGKQILDYILVDFFSRGWVKTGSDLKKSVDIGSYLLSITQKHFGDKEYNPKEVFNFEFLSPVIRNLSEWKPILDMLKQSENPFDLFQNGTKVLFQNSIITSTKDLEIIKKISKSAGHNANNIFSFAVPVLAKHRVISTAKDLETTLKTLLDICNSVKYPENVLRDLQPFGEKNLLRNKKDLELIRDFLKSEKDEWKAQQKFYQIVNDVNSGKVRFSVDFKKYIPK